MRHIARTLCLLLALLAIAMPHALASEAQFERSKTGKITFRNVKRGATLKLNNRFGNIRVYVWDKDVIELDYKLHIKAESQSYADKMLESTEIIRQEEGNTYSLELRRNDTGNNDKQNSMESTWAVYVPENKLSLTVLNAFGDIHIPDYECAKLEAKVSFGTLLCQNIKADGECILEAAHGNLYLTRSNRAKVNASFCNVSIGKCNQLDMKNSHCKEVSIGTCNTLALKERFSHVSIGSFKDADMNIQHSTIDIGLATGKTTISSQHSSIELSQAGTLVNIPNSQHSKIKVCINEKAKFESFYMKGTFTDLNLRIPKQINAGYKLSSQFGSISIDGLIKHKNTHIVEKDFFSSKEGYFGTSSNAPTLFQIENMHGNINIK